MQDANGVQRIESAQQLDGEKHSQRLVEARRCGGSRGGGTGFGDVDSVEQRALRVVGFKEVAFVREEVEGERGKKRAYGARGGEARVRGVHDVEFPGRGRVFGFDGNEVFWGVGRGGRVRGEVDGREGAFAELALDGVRGGCVGELDGGWGGEVGGCFVGCVFGDFRKRFDEFADFGTFVEGQGSVIMVIRERGERWLNALEDHVADGVVHRIALCVFDDWTFCNVPEMSLVGRNCILFYPFCFSINLSFIHNLLEWTAKNVGIYLRDLGCPVSFST